MRQIYLGYDVQTLDIEFKEEYSMRAPYQILVIPYRKIEGKYMFAIFSRSDMECWQWIAGGGEDYDETVLESAKRESFEEATISMDLEYMKLDTITSIPVSIFGNFIWGEDVYVIPEYSFAVRVDENEMFLSDEHKEFKWVDYNEANNLLKYDSNKTALWELEMRLKEQ